MKRANFTVERVANFKCEPGKQQSIFWDGKAPGLGLRVTASGAKSYVFETRLFNKTLRITIGDARTWAIGKAQAEATRLKALTDQGIDPRQEKAEKRAHAEAVKAEAERQEMTVAEVWAAYLQAQKPKWGDRHYQDHINLASAGGVPRKIGKGVTLAGPLSSLMPIRFSDLTAERIAIWLQAESSTRPTNAEQSFRKLRSFVRWAADMPQYRGVVAPEIFSTRSVREVVPKSRPKAGDSLQREQLSAWFEAVRKIGNPVIAAYLQGLLLTGARREELAGLRWEDVDFQWRSLTIRDKVEGTRVIPLPPYLHSLLLNLKHINETPPPKSLKQQEETPDDWEPSPWVFFSKTAATGRIQEPRIAHTKALAVAGLPHVSLHGLRRSFGTLCEWVEMPAGISAQIMGHKPSALAEKHYRRRPLDLLRKWHDMIEAWILEQAGIKFEPITARLQAVA